jgi:acyl carrier protein
MENLAKYSEAFKSTFLIDDQQLTGLSYQSIAAWDSIGHMALIAALEDGFSIEMEIDDIIEFSSFEYGKQILKKYDIEIG